MTERTIKYEAERDPDFAEWVTTVAGGEKIRQCIQCGLCSALCPLSFYMDYTPRRLAHLAREGFRDEVLRSQTIWLCASCYACTVECPKQIRLTELMYALKRRAIQDGVYPKRFAIPILAREFHRMVLSRGRITESRLVMKLFLKTGILKMPGMTRMGIGLLRTGRFSLMADSIKQQRQLATLLDSVETREGAKSP